MAVRLNWHYRPAPETRILSKQLAISIAFSVMTMSAFALSMAVPQPLGSQGSGQKNGAIAEAAAPSFFRVFAD